MKRIVAIRDLLFSFRGRILRSVLWCGMLALLVYYGVGWELYALLVSAAKTPQVARLWGWLFILPVSWSFLAINFKRFHDRNLAGFWAIFNLIPVCVFVSVSPFLNSPEPAARLIPSIVLLFCIPYIVQIFILPGDKGENDFGPPPESLREWWCRTGR